MTVTLNLPPDVERAFLAQAQARGVTLDEFMCGLLLSIQPSPVSPADLSPEEWVRELKAWTRSHAPDNLPLLSDEAISRDFIYGDRGL
jgi:hypothetical protein